MTNNFSIERVDRKQNDLIILIFIFLLVSIGVIMMFSASYNYGLQRFGNAGYFISQQLIALAIGAALFVIAVKVPLELVRKMIPMLLFVSLLLILLTLIPGVSREVMGARRWLFLGSFSFQPSELVKFSLILYLANILSKKSDRIHDFINSVLPPLLVVGIFGTLVYLQNDFSSALFIFVVCFFIFFIAGVRMLYFFGIGVTMVPVTLILLFSEEYRANRFMVFFGWKSDPSGIEYQITKSLQSLSNGGFWGRGLGSGVAKIGRLPEVQSDFVFASFAEEAGFLGVIFVLALFLGFGIRGIMLALKQKDKFKALLAFGLTVSILYQALINMAVVSNLLPTTGIPLPFFSHGGSSLMMILVMCGLLINISAGRRKEGE